MNIFQRIFFRNFCSACGYLGDSKLDDSQYSHNNNITISLYRYKNIDISI